MLKLQLLDTGYFIDNSYLDDYVQLISSNATTQYESFVTQSHHIIPTSYFKRRHIAVDNSAHNRVTLKFKDHIIAHYLLYFCSIDKFDQYSNMCAINHLCGFAKERSIDFDISTLQLDKIQQMYSESRKHFVQQMTGRFCGDLNPARRLEVRAKISAAKKGHLVSDETRRLISLKNKGKKRKPYNYTDLGYSNLVQSKLGDKNPAKREDVRKLNSEAHKGKIRVTNGVENKTISPQQFEEYIAKGYWRGLIQHLNKQ